MGRALDRTREHTMRKTMAGTYVCMYKDDPGRYFNVKGVEIDEDEARNCGYDIEANKVDAKRLAMRADALREVEKKMAAVEAEVEKKIEAEAKATPEPVLESKENTGESRSVAPVDDVPAVRIVGTNANGAPRETQRLKMEGGQAGRWTVIEKATGETVHTAKFLDTRTAEKYLLEQAG